MSAGPQPAAQRAAGAIPDAVQDAVQDAAAGAAMAAPPASPGPDAAAPSRAPAWAPRGGGAVGELVRSFDWAATSLGPLADWPPSLRGSVDIVLNSPIAMVLMWGPDHVMVYNEGYADIAGARHPAALGGTVPAIWPEIWDWNRRVLEAGFRGEAQRHEENRMVLLRNGAPEEVWFDLFYTPVHAESGAVGGVLCTVVETTAKVAERQQQARAGVELDVLNRSLQGESAAVREANRQLREERAVLAALFEQSPSFMAVLRGPDHVVEMANEPFHRAGAQRIELGRPLCDCLPELREQGYLDLLDMVYRSGVPFAGKELRSELAGQDGPRYADFVYHPIRDDDGTVGGILIEGTDVTERMETAQRLHLSQQAGGIGSFEWFPDSGRMLVSTTYRRLWGLADDETVTAASLVDLVDERDRHKVGTNRLGGQANPLEYVEYRVRRPDNGQLRWLARQGEVLDGPMPGQRRYVGVIFDITERKEIEQALRSSQDRLAAIFGQASVGLSELGLDGTFQRVNGALCSMLGRPAEELLGMNMHSIIHPDDVASSRALFECLVATGAAFTNEKRYLKPDLSQVWVASNVSRLDDEHGRPVALIAVKTDITERRRVEAALRDLNETLEQRVAQEVAERTKAEQALVQAQKMEAVGQLTGGIAHDFNNVLQIISGNLQLLSQRSGQEDSTRRRLETAIAAVERGAKLSSHLLSFARRQPLQPVVVDLGRLVANMDELLRRALGEAVEVSTVLGRGLWNTQVDPSQMENVVLNLAINARDAMAGAGRLTIELGNAVLDEQYVQSLVDVAPGQYVMLSVSDSGCGMSEQVMRRAFEPFFTTKPDGEGTGLGLSMAYGFVKQSHGHIRIVSELGQGTSVKIYLPRTLAEAADEALPAGARIIGGSETVLVVEDDAGVRSTVVDMLSALGYRVLMAEDGARALALLQGPDGAGVDLLFTDVVMPGPLRSTELVRLARELAPDLAVLFTSGYPQDAIVHGGRLDAGVELLSKPYRREQLAAKLRHVLANRQQRLQARDLAAGAATVGLRLTQETLVPGGEAAVPTSLKILVVEDNLDSQQMVCELVGMLGHTVSGVSDGEAAWELLAAQDFDILFTDVSLPGMSGIALARKVYADKPAVRIIFSTGYGKEALDGLGFEARILRKPYDLMELKAALDTHLV